MINRIVVVLLNSCVLLLLSLSGVFIPQPVQAYDNLIPGPDQTDLIAFTGTFSTTAHLNEVESEPPPTYIKGLYMTYSAVGHKGLRTHALDLVDTTELNAVVIDIKGDKGLLTYKSNVVTATAIGANEAPTMRDWPAFMQDLKARNIYAIARIVVFKDAYFGRAHPEWAVKTETGELWVDREELPWLEPFHPEVWDYNVALAVEAAERGFDEVQFDYVRFPTDGRLSNIVYSQPIDEPAVRTKAINGFLARAHKALEPYDTKLAVDVFGYTTWHKGDFRIGQDLSQMAAYLDVLSPMVYPSTYDHGLPGMPEYDVNTVAYPYEVVYESMIRAMSRIKATNPDIILRPWIQDFPDYGFDRRTYTPDEIREQMFASYDAGGGGWLLWDPRVRFTSEALVTADVFYSPNEQGEIMALRYENFGDEDALPLGNGPGAVRSLAGFRQDLEQLWTAGYYPVNLRDLAVGNAKYKQDLENLSLNGWRPIESVELLARNFNYIPAGKRPVILTFDGSHISQYRLLEDGALDPNSAMGVLKAFHDEHPADWPLRATFFVKTDANAPDYQLFGQPELTTQKLQDLVEWRMEIGSYAISTGGRLDSNHEALRRQLSGEVIIEEFVPGYEVDSLALPRGQRPQFKNLLRRGTYNNQFYDYNIVAVNGDKPIPSPHTEAFNPYRIHRIEATPDAVETWLEFYRNASDVYYIAAGIVPDTKPVR